MMTVEDALRVLEDRWHYFDRAAAMAGEGAILARHEVWRCHQLVSEAAGLPVWEPVPTEHGFE